VNEALGEVGVDAPVAAFVGIGQRTARDIAAKAGVVKPLFKRAQAALDIPQAFAGSQLRKGHAEKLIIAGKGAHAVVALVPIHALAKRMPWKKLHQLRENGLSLVHACGSFHDEFFLEGVPKRLIQIQIDNSKNRSYLL
jgi:hypothetical protein